MMQPETALERARHLQALTREYSRYSRTAGGLSAVLGGAACLVAYLAGALLPLTSALRVALVATPVLWLVAKQWLAHRYYQRYGHVEELPQPAEARAHRFFVVFTALVSVVVAASVVRRIAPLGEQPFDLRIAGYVAVVLALPFVVHRWLRAPLEFVVGAFLFCQAALAFVGRTYGFDLATAVFPVASIALVVVGLRDHRRFRGIEHELLGCVGARAGQG